jgi:hypothetical protein
MLALVDEQVSRSGFLVWVARDGAGRLVGTVERVRTGERHRFLDVADLPQLITRMSPATPPAEGATPCDA